MRTSLSPNWARNRVLSLTAVLLAIELLDELVFGTREAAWPLIRSDLRLSYGQVGLLLAIPGVVSGLVEPLAGMLGDTRHRRSAVLYGGVAFSVSLIAAAWAHSMAALLIAFAVLYPASGAFVSLSQASLVDAHPAGHEAAMARWAFAGSVGAVSGPVILTASLFVGGTWRLLFISWSVLAVVLLFCLARSPFQTPRSADSGSQSLSTAVRVALDAARRRETMRWLLLLACSDLLLDVLLGFVALYLVSSTGATAAGAALAVSILALTGLAGDGLIIILLRRMAGLTWIRASSLAAILAFALFLIVPGFLPKVVLLVVIGLLNSGWYAVLKAQLYRSLPGRSGAVMAISAAFDLVTALIPATLGLIASRFGISIAMLLLLAGPVGLFLGLANHRQAVVVMGDTAAPTP